MIRLDREGHPPRAAVVLAAAAAMFAPGRCLGSGYEFEGVGARQVARGGAAIADAEDWTAGYWNPGNIVRAARKDGRQIGMEVFGGIAHGRDTNSLSALPGVGAIFGKATLDSPFVLGAIGAVVPVGDKAGLGFGVYTPLLQGSDFRDQSGLTGTQLDYRSSAGIIAFNASASMEVTPSLSAGLGANLIYGQISSESTLANPPGLPGVGLHSKFSGDGFGAEAVGGLRYDPDPKVSLGLVARSGSNVVMKGPAGAASNLFPAESTRFTFNLRHPPTTGIGAAYRPNDRWTLTADCDQTYWRGFRSAIGYETQGNMLVNLPNTFHWRNTWKWRFGAAERLTPRTEILAGYSIDRPAVDAGSIDLSTTIDVPMHRFYGGVAQRLWENVETVLGIVVGTGHRTEGDVNYNLAGWQLMSETRLTF